MALSAQSYQDGGAPLTSAGRRVPVRARIIQGPTSAVVTEVHDWADASLLLFHEPIRLDLLEMDHVMSPEYFDGLSGWKIEIFFKWYKAYFHPLVRHYLQDLEAAILPAVMTQDSSLNKDDLLSMHPWITNKLEQVRGFRRRFRTAANRLDFAQSVQEQRQTARDLRGCIKELLTCLTEHLARLEMVLLPIIRDRFSEEEWRELTCEMLLGPHGKKLRSKQLPWVLAALKVWASQERVASFQASLPWWTRFRLEYFWYCSYVQGPAKRLRLIKNDYIRW